MYKKKLYRTALLSSPIMAAFELSPIFFLQEYGYPLSFWSALITFTILTMSMWGVNIYVVNIWLKSGRKNNKEWYALSYILHYSKCESLQSTWRRCSIRNFPFINL